MASSDVKELTKIVAPLTDPSNKDLGRRNLATLLLRMLSTSITQNESDHAQYLPLLRKLGSYAAADLFSASIQDIKAQLDTFADEISAIEAKDAAAAAAAITG